MAKKIKIPSSEGPLDGTEIGFRAVGEHWNEYLLDDGTILRNKSVLTDIVRVEGKYNEEGQPLYLFKTQNVSSSSVPPELMQTHEEGENNS